MVILASLSVSDISLILRGVLGVIVVCVLAVKNTLLAVLFLRAFWRCAASNITVRCLLWVFVAVSGVVDYYDLYRFS